MSATRLGDGKSSLTNIAYEELKKNILSGNFQPGHRLVVNDLVTEWDISNTPIKEALNRLVSEGLVEFEPRRGMRVRRQLTGREAREKYEMRLLLEEYCCRQAATNNEHRREVTDRLLSLLKDMKDLLACEENAPQLYRLDGEFHSAITSLCDNSEIVRQINLINAEILTFGLLTSRSFPLRRQAATFEEHRDIVSALLRRDADEAGAAMHRHLCNAMEHLLSFYDRTTGRPSP